MRNSSHRRHKVVQSKLASSAVSRLMILSQKILHQAPAISEVQAAAQFLSLHRTGGPSGCPADILGPGGTELDDIEFVDIEFELSSPCNIGGPSGCPFDVIEFEGSEFEDVVLVLITPPTELDVIVSDSEELDRVELDTVELEVVEFDDAVELDDAELDDIEPDGFENCLGIFLPYL
ncbi:hypothetical protein JMJ35_007200 [Cladonia borealis]|uniref:Uncharacterized protein n=1 Tax=Cladonia borealis TaxID=184061 RepID=A0AA39QX13_9LECA|nr:hypothetical protein JMJ35_007200 [Cladonia borealis]